MNENNIFDLSNVSDLPKNMQSELANSYEMRLIVLFNLADKELNLDELQVAYFRKYGEYKKRLSITQKLYTMCLLDNSTIVKVGRGLWKKRD